VLYPSRVRAELVYARDLPRTFVACDVVERQAVQMRSGMPRRL